MCMTDHTRTLREFDKALSLCRELFVRKLGDYGPAWRIMRPCSLTDQIFIKAGRIRSLQTKGESMIDEGILPEFIGIVNYGIIALIQLELGDSLCCDITNERAIELYDLVAAQTRDLMIAKNHDYDEAWRGMRMPSYTDLILMKIFRTKQIEDHNGATDVSEGVDANYKDMINYAVFAIIKLAIEN